MSWAVAWGTSSEERLHQQPSKAPSQSKSFRWRRSPPTPISPVSTSSKKAFEELCSPPCVALGLVQPITVQALSSGSYQIISGERRWRAAQLAGLKTLPAYIRSTQEGELLELALIENIQREDLNAIEIALAYQQLIEQHSLTQAKLAERVGKKRVTISNYIRLLHPLPCQ